MNQDKSDWFGMNINPNLSPGYEDYRDQTMLFVVYVSYIIVYEDYREETILFVVYVDYDNVYEV